MPQAARVLPQEQEEIIKIAAKIKAEKPQTTFTAIGKEVGRSKQVVSKLSKTEKFELYRNKFKQKIDKKRFEAISKADNKIIKQINKKSTKLYQLIGLSKIYYEQSFGLAEQQAQNNNQVNVGVSIVREAPHSNPVGTDEPE